IEDDLGGAREAVTHLARHGHRRVAFFGVSTPVTTTYRRLRGYKAAVTENGLADRPDLVCMPFESPSESAAELVKRLAAPDPPTAGFSSDIPWTMALRSRAPTAPRRVMLENPPHDGARARPAPGRAHRRGGGRVRRHPHGRGPGSRRHRPGSGPRRTRAHRRGTAAPAHRRPERTGATQDRAPGPADPEGIGRVA